VSQSTIQLCPIEEDDGIKEKTETKKRKFIGLVLKASAPVGPLE